MHPVKQDWWADITLNYGNPLVTLGKRLTVNVLKEVGTVKTD